MGNLLSDRVCRCGFPLPVVQSKAMFPNWYVSFCFKKASDCNYTEVNVPHVGVIPMYLSDL